MLTSHDLYWRRVCWLTSAAASAAHPLMADGQFLAAQCAVVVGCAPAAAEADAGNQTGRSQDGCFFLKFEPYHTIALSVGKGSAPAAKSRDKSCGCVLLKETSRNPSVKAPREFRERFHFDWLRCS
jgi:hypothetical protein